MPRKQLLKSVFVQKKKKTEGILPGGGVALLYATRYLEKLPTANFDQKIVVQIIQNPLNTVLSEMVVTVWKKKSTLRV